MNHNKFESLYCICGCYLPTNKVLTGKNIFICPLCGFEVEVEDKNKPA